LSATSIKECTLRTRVSVCAISSLDIRNIEEVFPMPGIIAYFDLGSGSMLLQAIVGGTAGVLVFARYLWQKAPSILRSHDWNNESNSGT
jgi:hypothetical protein